MPPRCGDPTTRALLPLLVLTNAALMPAQSADSEPELQLAIASAPLRARLPALAWVCERWLPQQACWPAGLDPNGSFQLTVRGNGVAVGRSSIELGPDTVLAGTLRLGAGEPVLVHGARDGVEDWYAPATAALPDAWHARLVDLDAHALDTPRTLATAVAVGHLAGGLAPDDPRASLLHLAAAACGDVTWLAWRDAGGFRVRGRSDGGLCLPALLCVLASHGGPEPHGRSVRAFAARDGDRPEAARQLARSATEVALPALRAMLYADDPTRLAAIDSLVRRGASAELPAIVAAGTPEAPWATLAARDALAVLWDSATPDVRQRTRAAIARSQSVALRAIDLDALPRTARPGRSSGGTNVDPAPATVRALSWLACLGVGLCIWWLRERARLHAATHA